MEKACCDQHTESRRIENGEGFLRDVLQSLVDPITLEIMVDPVLAADNVTYDRQSIKEWFKTRRTQRKPIISPSTREILSSSDLRINLALKSILGFAIDQLRSKEATGTISAEEKDILESYRMRVEACRLEQAAMMARIVRCPLQHDMQNIPRNTIPPEYSANTITCTVSCDVCSRGRIESRGYYFHCGECGVDVCQHCSELDNVQELIDLHIPFITAALGSLRIHPEPPAVVDVAVTRHPHFRRPSSIFRRANRFIAGAILTATGAPANLPSRTCLRRHPMDIFRRQLPPGYSGNVLCDGCGADGLESAFAAFYHCRQCQHDYCCDCGEAMQVL